MSDPGGKGLAEQLAPDLATELLRFERALAARDPDGVEGGLMTLIPEDFLEFGASGRVWTSADIPDALAEPPREDHIEDFAVIKLGPDAALTTYRIGGDRPSNRSSLWLRRDGRWVMRFHQGTLRPDPPAG